MKWKLPKRVKGVLHNWKVKKVDEISAYKQTVYGDTDPDTGVVHIAEGKKSIECQSFFHELIHIAEQEVGMKPLKDKPDNSDAERLGLALYSIWRRNGWVLPGQKS